MASRGEAVELAFSSASSGLYARTPCGRPLVLSSRRLHSPRATNVNDAIAHQRSAPPPPELELTVTVGGG